MTAEEEESIPVTIGRKEGYTLHRSPVCRTANTENQTTIHTVGNLELDW